MQPLVRIFAEYQNFHGIHTGMQWCNATTERNQMVSTHNHENPVFTPLITKLVKLTVTQVAMMETI